MVLAARSGSIAEANDISAKPSTSRKANVKGRSEEAFSMAHTVKCMAHTDNGIRNPGSYTAATRTGRLPPR